jgi:hypothetical protein
MSTAVDSRATRSWPDAGTKLVLAGLNQLTDAELDAPSALELLRRATGPRPHPISAGQPAQTSATYSRARQFDGPRVRQGDVAAHRETVLDQAERSCTVRPGTIALYDTGRPYRLVLDLATELFPSTG